MPPSRPCMSYCLVLYGGTAVALHLGHRPSVDFDFFTSKPLNKDGLRKAFPLVAQATSLQETPDSYTFLVPCGGPDSEHVKVSFFGAIDIGRVSEPLWTDDGILQVADLDDLMATKVKVLLQRIEAKDYQDIAAMVNAGVSLSRGLASARAMYEPDFQPSESLKALTYFSGGDLSTLTPEIKNTLVDAVSQVHDLPHVELLARDLSQTG